MELCSFAKIILIVFMVFILELLCHPGDLEFLLVFCDLFCPLTELFICQVSSFFQPKYMRSHSSDLEFGYCYFQFCTFYSCKYCFFLQTSAKSFNLRTCCHLCFPIRSLHGTTQRITTEIILKRTTKISFILPWKY